MRIKSDCIVWVLLALIAIANLVAIINIIKLFIYNRAKLKTKGPLMTTTETYANELRVTTRILDVEERHASEPGKQKAVFLPGVRKPKLRRRYRYDMKTGRYIRVRAKGRSRSRSRTSANPVPTVLLTTSIPISRTSASAASSVPYPERIVEEGTSRKFTTEMSISTSQTLPSRLTPPMTSEVVNNVRTEDAFRDTLTTAMPSTTSETIQGVLTRKESTRTARPKENATTRPPSSRPPLTDDTRHHTAGVYVTNRGHHPRRKVHKQTTQTQRTTTPTTTTTELRFAGVTLVTALLDIGRGNWWEYRRPFESYLEFLDRLLELRINLVIFVDTKTVDYVLERRKQFRMDHITKVVPLSLSDLPLYEYLRTIETVIAHEQTGGGWNSSWDDSMRVHPEAKSAEYDLLVNSKSYFLYNASRQNPFLTEYFVWLDAGYGHGDRSIFPTNFEWDPSFPPSKISLIKVTPEFDPIERYTLTDLYRKDWAVISGGFMGGDRDAINRFHRFYHRLVIELVHQRFIDDDQTTLVLLIQQQPYLFNVLLGGWFDAFRLFK